MAGVTCRNKMCSGHVWHHQQPADIRSPELEPDGVEPSLRICKPETQRVMNKYHIRRDLVQKKREKQYLAPLPY